MAAKATRPAPKREPKREPTLVELMPGYTPRPDPAEVLSLPQAAEIAGLARITLYMAYRLGRLEGVHRPRTLAMRSGGEYVAVTRLALHHYLLTRQPQLRKPLPADYRYPRGCFWPGVDTSTEADEA